MTGATRRAGTAYPSQALEFTPVFSGVHVAQTLVFCFKRNFQKIFNKNKDNLYNLQIYKIHTKTKYYYTAHYKM